MEVVVAGGAHASIFLMRSRTGEETGALAAGGGERPREARVSSSSFVTRPARGLRVLEVSVVRVRRAVGRVRW